MTFLPAHATAEVWRYRLPRNEGQSLRIPTLRRDLVSASIDSRGEVTSSDVQPRDSFEALKALRPPEARSHTQGRRRVRPRPAGAAPASRSGGSRRTNATATGGGRPVPNARL